MFCSCCGANLPEGASFCGNCGAVPEGAPVQPIVETPYYQPQGEFAMKQATPGRGFAIASLVCGICSFFLFGIILGILGLVFGVVAKQKGSTSGMATAGIVCGIIGFVLTILVLVFFSRAMLMFM